PHRGALHSSHDDGGCYDRPHRHPFAVHSDCQPSWNRDCVTGSLVLHRSCLCCPWPRCVTNFGYPTTVLSAIDQITLRNVLCAPSAHHRRDICEARRSLLT